MQNFKLSSTSNSSEQQSIAHRILETLATKVMEKTITKIKTLKNRRKLSLPSSSPKLSDDRAAGGGGTGTTSGVGSSSPAPNKTRRVSDAMYTPTVRPRNNSLSPYDDHGLGGMVSSSASPMKYKRKVGWSPALDRKTMAGAAPPSIIAASENDASSDTDNNLHHEENGDSPYDPQLSSEKLSAMRKSLRSRSIGGGGGGSATPPPSISSAIPAHHQHHHHQQQLSPAATPHHSPGYSLMAGLKGVNSFVTATGTHISTSRRLSTPCSTSSTSSSSASMFGGAVESSISTTSTSHHRQRRMTSTQRPLKATHRSKRSESASTVEEEALKLRAILAGRHPSLPVVVVNHSDYIHCTMTRHRSK